MAVFERSSDGSPLTAKPLRNPGQSLDEAIDRLIDSKVQSYLFFPAIFWLLVLFEWGAGRLKMPRSPGIFALGAIVLSAWSAWRLWQVRRLIGDIKLGRDGERAVGQFLERLRTGGAQVFHDVPAKGFNVDHVVISEQGVFAIETKTWRKPHGKARIRVRDGKLYRGHMPADPNPLEQAAGQARWLEDLLRESTGKTFPVRAVLLFPGWFIEPVDRHAALPVWLLEPKALPGFLEHETASVASSDAAMAAYHLSRYVRTSA
jgi:hypothetical protein